MAKGRLIPKKSADRLEVNMVDACELRASELRTFHCIQ